MSVTMVDKPSTQAGKERVPIGWVIKAWRNHHQFSQAKLAELTNISPAYIWKLEHNEVRRPNPDYLQRIVDALEITIDQMYTLHMPEGMEVPISELPTVSLRVYEQLEGNVTFTRNTAALNLDEQALAVEEIVAYAEKLVALILKHKEQVQPT